MADYDASGFCVIRSPILPLRTFTEWLAEAKADSPAGEHSAGGAGTILQALRARLATHVESPRIADSIFLASPSLFDSISAWAVDPDGKKGRKTERALVKYFARMSGRATPFGLFSGCSVGRIGASTTIEFAAPEAHRRSTRLDMDYVFALTEMMGSDPGVRRALRYYPNQSLYEVAGRYRYCEGRVRGRSRSYHLVSVERTEYLTATLERAADGACLQDLAAALVDDDPEVDMNDALAYVGELADTQILRNSLAPLVTGTQATQGLIADLRAHRVAPSQAKVLENVVRDLDEVDRRGLGSPVHVYRGIAETLKELPVPIEISRLFQADVVKPVHRAELGPEIILEIRRGVDALYRIGREGPSVLDSFAEAFKERYGERWVRLPEALDEEAGLGFQRSADVSADTDPLLEGIRVGVQAGAPTLPTPSVWGVREQVLVEKLAEGARVLSLQMADIASMASPQRQPLPDALVASLDIISPSADRLNEGDFKIRLKGIFGPSGARMLGRFCHADPELEALVRGHIQREERHQPDAVFAEVVHLPEGRLGNILSRPVLRDYEIPFLGRSGASIDRQIPVSDLYVSVRANRVVLRSKRLDREVIPRLTSAHNYANGQSVYRFLCSLQSQGCREGVSWSWGVLQTLPFLPRVEIGRVIVSRATWRLTSGALKPLAAAEGAERFEAVQGLRERLRLPRLVELMAGDNELPVDLDNPLSVDAFVDEVGDKGEATVCELLPGPDELLAAGPDGRFATEILVPFVRSNSASSALVTPRAASPNREASWRLGNGVQRQFLPGSEWLYLKIYSGTAIADTILRCAIAPIVRTALDSQWADRWFFIRYSDPQPHLRVRFHGDPVALATRVQPMLHDTLAELLGNSSVWRVQLDTYEREVERYGGDYGMEICENAFWADSEAVLAIMALLAGDGASPVRWQLALLGVDAILRDMQLDLPKRKDFAEEARKRLGSSVGMNGPGAQQVLSDKYRAQRRALDALFSPVRPEDDVVKQGAAAIAIRSQRMEPLLEELRARSDSLSAGMMDLTRSFVHMHVNRMMRSGQVPQELILYDFLERRYKSDIARRPNGKVGREPEPVPESLREPS